MASITVRISDQLKKELQETGINISEITRKALEAEVKKVQEQRAREAAHKFSQLLTNIPDEDITKIIREIRDQR